MLPCNTTLEQRPFLNSLSYHQSVSQSVQMWPVIALHNGTTNASLCIGSKVNTGWHVWDVSEGRLPRRRLSLCGNTLRQSCRLRQAAARQWCSAGTGAVHTGVYSPSVSALHRSRHSQSLPFLTHSHPGAGSCHVFFSYSIVMAKCIFLMSCIAEEGIPVGRRRWLLFLKYMVFGTRSYNDFLWLLFKHGYKKEECRR